MTPSRSEVLCYQLDNQGRLPKSELCNMKSDGPMKHFILAFLLALICYAFFYNKIENRRTRKGPWEITFTNDVTGNPMLVINQPRLAITNAQVTFTNQHLAQFSPATLVFREPKPVPYPVPFGQCVFMDTTFLPGTIALEIFNHEVELRPRDLVIDRQEHPWLSESTITLHPLTNEAPVHSPGRPE
jgi:hypothetical protein